MEVLDLGHLYELPNFDGKGSQMLRFMKREGSGYPFNAGHYPGTNCQEVIRALIDRTKYLDTQISAPENDVIIAGLRSALLAFELRAARRHGLELPAFRADFESVPTCAKCGHIVCPHRNIRP